MVSSGDSVLLRRQERWPEADGPIRNPPAFAGAQVGRRTALTRQHRPQALAAEEMDMQVRHFLPAMRADIGEQAVARRDQPLVPRDLADRADEAGDLGVRA